MPISQHYNCNVNYVGIHPSHNVLQYEQNPVRVNRTNLHWALCIPSSCNNVDLQTSLNNTVYPIFEANDLSIEIEVSPGQCQVQQSRPYSIGFYIVT